MSDTPVAIRPWAEGDLHLLEWLLGDPLTMAHLGGPESPETIAARHRRYLDSTDAAGGLFAILAGPEMQPVGWVGYWESSWQGKDVWEAGWHVLPEFQGRGIATRATALTIEKVRARGGHRYLHAFPSVENLASNGVCRALRFVCCGEVDVEYPPGRTMRSNDWRLDLLG